MKCENHHMEDANKELIDLRAVPFDHVKMLASNKILKMNTMNLQNQQKKDSIQTPGFTIKQMRGVETTSLVFI